VGDEQGGPVTFEEFVTARLAALLRQATALAGDSYLAEDVVQEVLLQAQSRWAKIGLLEAPEAYIRNASRTAPIGSR
jgi:DNA-directed RNA polymerase specialized sigma24 family protein